MTRHLLVMVATVGTLGAMPAVSLAQQRAGVRAGISSDPTQFVFGGHVETGPLLDRLVFRPNAEIGVGDNAVLVALNLEFAYRIPIQGKPWWAYLGAGPALNVLSIDRPGGDDTDVDGGFNILVGVQHDGGLFTEFKVGTAGSPDLKWVVGYAF